jgi:hypothetical protein
MFLSYLLQYMDHLQFCLFQDLHDLTKVYTQVINLPSKQMLDICII